MAVAIALGVLSGIAGFLPLYGSLQLAKRATKTSNLGHMGSLLLGLLVSFLLLFGTALSCILIARDATLPFVLAEVLALIVAAIGFGVMRLVRK